MGIFKKTVFFYIAVFAATAAGAADLTLGEIRAKYLDQPVRIGGHVSLDKLQDWHPVRRDSNGLPVFHRLYGLSPAFKLATGKVVSVELDKKPETSVDAFGREVDHARTKNPYMVIIVRLDDGTEAATVAYEHRLHGDALQLVSEAQQSRKDIDAALSRLAGKSVYLPMYQKVYPATTPLATLLETVPSALPLSFRDVPRATALKILETKYLDGDNRVLIRLALPKGEEGIMVGDTEHFYLDRNYRPSDLERLGFYAETSLKKFAPREISSIKEVGFYRGMRKQALYWSVGLPEKENDYGRGGEQVVFPLGLIVYLKNDRVTDWQRL